MRPAFLLCSLWDLASPRPEVPERLRDGVVAELVLIKLPGAQEREKCARHDVGEGVEIVIAEAGFILQGGAGFDVCRSKQLTVSRMKSDGIPGDERQGKCSSKQSMKTI